jgi:hypothetical protein
LTVKELYENNTILKLSPPHVHFVKKKIAQHAIIANDTNIYFEQMVANKPKFLQKKNYIHRFHCDDFIIFVRLGPARIYRNEIR